jgi:hypothetical protein
MIINKDKIKNLNLDCWLEKTFLFFNKFLAYIPILLLIFIVYTLIFPIDYIKMNKDNFAKREYSGIVVKRFIDYPNHASPTIIFSNNNKKAVSLELFSNISVGDSVVKKQGELIVNIYKINGKLVVFDYLKDSEDFKH